MDGLRSNIVTTFLLLAYINVYLNADKLYMPDDVLIQSLKNGDRHAIKHFMDSYGSFIYSIIFNILKNSFTTEEATQDSIMKIIRSLDKYNSSSSFKAWCYTIAYRTGIDYVRKNKATIELSPSIQISDEKSADHLIQYEEKNIQIQDLLSILDEESRNIVTLFYLEEKNIKEVCSLTGLTESNIKVKLFRARKIMSEYASKHLCHF